ncbi:hypothetical protein ACIBQ1_52210 [Nonomuraea sp. NPDC050153]|uniref:hypothetical protein n=1 Tax=Nonomuraea sp. NPDC050153 TaxID=3364359 RepID=UPI0037948025
MAQGVEVSAAERRQPGGVPVLDRDAVGAQPVDRAGAVRVYAGAARNKLTR